MADNKKIPEQWTFKIWHIHFR